jgi:hypothetical protein
MVKLSLLLHWILVLHLPLLIFQPIQAHKLTVRLEQSHGFLSIDFPYRTILDELEVSLHFVNTASVFRRVPKQTKIIVTRLQKAIDVVSSATNQFGSPSKQRQTRAPFEFIGSLESTLFGTPSPSQFRKSLQLMASLQTQAIESASVAASIGSTELHISSILQQQTRDVSLLETDLTKLHKETTAGWKEIQDEVDIFERFTLAFYNIESILENTYLNLNTYYNTIALAPHHKLSRRLFPPSDLIKALNNRVSPPGLFIPYMNLPSFYYINPLCNIVQDDRNLSVILKIPYMGNFTYEATSHLLPSETHHHLKIAKYIESSNGFRYLTDSDIKTCSVSPDQSTLLCPKRRIEIKKSFRGLIFIHDVSATTLLVDITLPEHVVITIVCKESIEKLTLPAHSNLTLRLDCEIQSDFFRVWPLPHLIAEPVHTASHTLSQRNAVSLFNLVNHTTQDIVNINSGLTRLHKLIFPTASDFKDIELDVNHTRLVTQTMSSLSELNNSEIFSLLGGVMSSTWMIWIPIFFFLMALCTALYCFIQFKFKAELSIFSKLLQCFRKKNKPSADFTPSAPPAVSLPLGRFSRGIDPNSMVNHLSASLAPLRAGVVSKKEFDRTIEVMNQRLDQLDMLCQNIPHLVRKTSHM